MLIDITGFEVCMYQAWPPTFLEKLISEISIWKGCIDHITQYVIYELMQGTFCASKTRQQCVDQ